VCVCTNILIGSIFDEINYSYNGVDFVRSESKPKEKMVFKLPAKSRTMDRIYDYLMRERYIDPEVISFFVHLLELFSVSSSRSS
jgi:hypothetical protein